MFLHGGELIGFGATPAAAGTPGSTGTWGDSAAGGRGLSNASGENAGFQFTAPATGTVTSVEFDIVSYTSGGDYEARLYTNNSGSPGTQIGTSSATVTIGATGTVTFTFGSPPSITSATVYWIVMARLSGTINFNPQTVTNNASYGSGRNNTITSITNSLPSSEDWKCRVNYLA